MNISRAAHFVLACSIALGAAAAQSPSITWHDRPLADSLAEAATAKRPVLVYFWMEGSQHCADLWEQTLSTKAAHKDLASFVCHSAKATTKAGRELVQRYNVRTLPSLLVVRADGKLDDAVLGFVPPAAFSSEMQRVVAGSQTITSLRAAVEANPGDLTKRFALAQKYDFVGDRPRAEAQLAAIRGQDPDGATIAGAEVLLFDIRQKISQDAKDKANVATWDLKPMYSRLAVTRQPTVLFKGHSWLAIVEGQRGDRNKQRAAWRAAWPHAPATQASEWAGEVLLNYWNQRDDSLTTKDRKITRAMAKHLVADADAANSQATAEQRAFLLRGAACGLAVGGKLIQARKVIARAIELQPEDGELIALADQLKK